MQEPSASDFEPAAGMSKTAENVLLRQELLRLQGGGDPFAAAVRGTTLSMAISDPRQHDNPIVFVNGAFLRLTGYERDEVVGRNCRFLVGPDSDPDVIRRVRAALVNAQPIEIDIRNVRKDGTRFWNRLMLAPVRDAAGQLAFFFASQRDVTIELEPETTRAAHDCVLKELAHQTIAVTVRKEAGALELGDDSLRVATEAAEIGIWDLDITSNKLMLSARARLMFGIPPAAQVTLADLHARIHPRDRATSAETFAAAIDPAVRAAYDLQHRVADPGDQNVRRLMVKGKGPFDQHGQCRRVAGIVVDVTRQRRTRSGWEQHDLLDHAVPNQR